MRSLAKQSVLGVLVLASLGISGCLFGSSLSVKDAEVCVPSSVTP